MRRWKWSVVVLLLPVSAIQAQPERLPNGIRETEWVVLQASAHPLARPEFDQGSAARELALPSIVIGLSKTERQQAEENQLLTDLQDLKSPQYHQWLTPEQYAERFGVNRKDIDRITAWLEGAGFKVLRVSRARNMIVFSGTSAQVEQALRAPIHLYRVDGEMHFANAVAPSLPKDLAELVTGFRGLTDFIPKPPRRQLRALAKATDAARGARPDLLTSQGINYLVPDDLATIYDTAALVKAGTNGTGMAIAIAGDSDINMSDITSFRNTYHLPMNAPTKILVPGTQNPGQNGNMSEADLDLEWSGAMAPNATILYVFSPDAFLSTFYVIDEGMAPVVSTSFSVCEWHLEVGDFALLRDYSQEAAVEGITWVASSGDSGAAGCESDGGPWVAAITRLSVNMPASLPEVTGVGGSEFSESGKSYYSSTPGPNGGTAISYIPEVAWNDESAVLQTSVDATILEEGGYGFAASGGGASMYWLKPVWQTGPGVPLDGARDVPDVAFNASPWHDPYVMVTGGSTDLVGGTSVAAPLFAGIVALMNQYVVAAKAQLQPGLGNINPMLYNLGQNYPTVYHDITSGSNIVPCVPDSTQDCPSSGVYGFSAGPGYDQVTGWGSVDAAKLASTWVTAVGTGARLVYDITTKQQWDGSCSRTYYQPTSWFLPTDASANVYFELNNVASTDQVTSQWTRPDGTVYANDSWSSGSGNLCYEDRMNIAGVAPANSPGVWHVLAYLNGTALFDLPVTISPVQLTNYMLTKAVSTTACSTPAPATTFYSTDQYAYVWFNVSGANAGDIASAKWIAPAGGTYATSTWSPLSSGGAYCFSTYINIAGQSPASTPGTWTVQATWNGYPLFTLSFSVTNP